MSDRRVFTLILLPLLGLTLILGLLVLNSPARAAKEAAAPAQVGLIAWNPLHNGLAMTQGADGKAQLASAPAEPAAVCTPDVAPMLSYWPLDETSGTAFSDVVDGNNGACAGGTSCPIPVSGKVSGAQSFRYADSDGILIAENPLNPLVWTSSESFSFEMWVKFTEACTGNKVFFGRYKTVAADAAWWVGCVATDASPTGGFPTFHMRSHGQIPPPYLIDDVAINDGGWHHVVAVRDSAAGLNILYVDGVEAISVAQSYTTDFTSTGEITIGYYEDAYQFDGSIDEVAVYDKALSATEVAYHYNAGAGQSYCNDTPTAMDDYLTTAENTDLDFTGDDLLSNDIDLDGDTLTIGSIDSTSGEGGTITNLGGGNYRYSPPAGYAGMDTFGYTASDGNGGTDTATVSITVVGAADNPPVAGNQAVTTNEDKAVTITLTATDPDGDPLTYSVVLGPAHGVLTGSGATLTYTPTGNYYGADSFTFKANDGKYDSNVATVSITVNPVNDAPVAKDQAVTTEVNVAINITLTATDPDINPLTYSLVTVPLHGYLTGTGSSLTYTPEADYIGSDSFTFKANDGTLDSNIATVAITVTPEIGPSKIFLPIAVRVSD